MTCSLGEASLHEDDEAESDGGPDPNDIVLEKEQIHDEMDLAQEMEMDRQLWTKHSG